MPDQNPLRWLPPMPARSPVEEHRAATPLELFFDLVFVVAIAQASGQLHHSISAGVVGEAVLSYGMVFFAIWWAWMNFTWFASTYDTDDVSYRLVVFVQMTGALMLAGGMEDAFAGDWTVVTWGYVVMRVAMVTQWLRAAAHHQAGRAAAHRMALGVAIVQVGWVGLLGAPAEWVRLGFLALVLCELAVPMWARRASPERLWHIEHIAERYGLFTIIVLGESILAGSTAIQSATSGEATLWQLGPVIAGGLLTVFSLWWMYFARSMGERLETIGSAFVWGYGHYVVFAAAAAVGAGLAVAVDYETGHAHVNHLTAGFAVAIPVAVFLLSLRLLHARAGEDTASRMALLPLAAILVLATPYSAEPVLVTGLIVAGTLGIKLVGLRHEDTSAAL